MDASELQICRQAGRARAKNQYLRACYELALTFEKQMEECRQELHALYLPQPGVKPDYGQVDEIAKRMLILIVDYDDREAVIRNEMTQVTSTRR
jgi:hypothetical protein